MPGERKKPFNSLWVCALAAALGVAVAGGDPRDEAVLLSKSRARSLDDRGLDVATAGELVAPTCETSVDCDDRDACTADSCIASSCQYAVIPGCVSCESTLLCPPVDLVFIMDTSGSMRDEADALCAGIKLVTSVLRSQGVEVNAVMLGITEVPDIGFTCLTDHVVNMLGGDVPGDGESCAFPESRSAYESWGPATAIVAERFAWSPGATRMIIPMSDEGPCNGSFPDGCLDPGDDRASIDNAAAIATSNNVIVSPITGTGSDDCVLSLASMLASATGGKAVQTKDPQADLAAAVYQLVAERCTVDTGCDDQNPCTVNDQCFDGVCIGTPIDGCLTCDTPQECDDGDACSDNNCDQGICTSSPNYDASADCCDPVDRLLTTIDDGNACTLDVCDPGDGQVSHPPAGSEVACDDGNVCTAQDRCDGSGGCQGVDLGEFLCSSDAECFGQLCNLTKGTCECGTTPLLCLTASAPTSVGGGCYLEGQDFTVDIELGASLTTVAGGQFLFDYNKDVLDFVGITPGATVDPQSPFVNELIRSVDEINGTVFYAVGVGVGGSGTRGPAVMARIHFIPIAPCSQDNLCLILENPFSTLLVDDKGRAIAFESCCSGAIATSSGDPILTCPESVSLNADAGRTSAVATWEAVTAEGGCDGPIDPVCTVAHSSGVDAGVLVGNGGRFSVGLYEFECFATDSCGAQATCSWSVEVVDANTLVVNLELSPPIAPTGQLERCITFELYSTCDGAPVVVQQDVTFGGLFDFTGQATGVTLSVPIGSYGCITARDAKHTLRSTAEPHTQDGKYFALFRGDPMFGGNWLVGGNVDDNHVIDGTDHALVLTQLLTTQEANTVCGTTGINADIDGDGAVTLDDLGFVQRNFLVDDGRVCCFDASELTGTSIGSALADELDRLVIAYDIESDVNGDGVVDESDVVTLLEMEKNGLLTRLDDGANEGGD